MSVDASAHPRPLELAPDAPTARTSRAHPVLRFLGRRIGAGALTLLVVSFLIFLATSALPGNVAEVALGRQATPEAVAALEARLGLDQPLLAQYWDWITGILHGDLGQSTAALAVGADTAPVRDAISQPLANSLILAAVAAVLLVPLALLLGVIAAVNAERVADYGISFSVLILSAFPEFVLGTFLVVLFFDRLHWLPPVALVPSGQSPLAHPDALVLPVMTLVGVAVGFAARQIRAGMLEALGQDYVTMARLNGLANRRVLLRYGLRNSLGPSVQSIAQTIQYLIGGIIVVETFFAYPGIGSVLVQAVSERDVTTVAAIAVILAAIYVVINIVADLVVVLLVPKLRTAL